MIENNKSRNVYSEGDGDPTCPHCKGRGVIAFITDKGVKTPITKPCDCVLVKYTINNLERGWKGLTAGDPVEKSALTGYQDKNVWFTATVKEFRDHLKHMASRMGPNWYFSVVTDADLMDAWLSRDLDVYDADIEYRRQAQVSNQYAALSDIAIPPSLLIIRLGVKAARNSAMSEVVLETLQLREHLSLPTWIVDLSTDPLQEGHIAYSRELGAWLQPRFKRIVLSKPTAQRINEEDLFKSVYQPVPQIERNSMPEDATNVYDKLNQMSKKSDEKKRKGKKKWGND
jgi:hypothetical protein